VVGHIGTVRSRSRSRITRSDDFHMREVDCASPVQVISQNG